MLAALLMATAVHTAAPAAGEVPICATLRDAIQSNEKELSQLTIDDIGDDSVPRITMRAAQSTHMVAEAEVNLSLMAQHRCTPYPRPIQAFTYEGAVLACNSALRAQPSGNSDLPEACKRSNWKATP